MIILKRNLDYMEEMEDFLKAKPILQRNLIMLEQMLPVV
ncbi:hypothetical protein C2W59_03350 [Bacillus pumilus]|uniref:Uncharacterized protein n=1 Tax=Bacillus pumilus TaxID=1408 RepID=A0AB34QPX3_BACPU|nr:hypothetical protein B4127_2820 [Bacillus pumilus]RAP04274.1 hypothetical protein C2W58_02204 [Bacillus pumilus]RAP22768.1 hypothetical protein C2W59_03350 [Bacillus pumilus]